MYRDTVISLTTNPTGDGLSSHEARTEQHAGIHQEKNFAIFVVLEVDTELDELGARQDAAALLGREKRDDAPSRALCHEPKPGHGGVVHGCIVDAVAKVECFDPQHEVRRLARVRHPVVGEDGEHDVAVAAMGERYDVPKLLLVPGHLRRDLG